MANPKDFIINGKDRDGNPTFSDPNLFNNTFDTTWMWGTEDDDYSQELTIIPVEGDTPDDGEILYSYNKDGFRSDNFTSNHDGTHILFAGCSQTEGVGSPIHDIWPKMVYDELSKKNKLSGFYSIGRSGFGWQKVMLNFVTYVEKYGYPEYFFVMLPNVGRLWEWDDKTSRWWYVQRYPNGQGLEEIPDYIDYFSPKQLTVQEHRKSFIDFVAGWKVFEKLCKDNGVKLLWCSWDTEENKNYLNSNFSKTYFHTTNEEMLYFISKERPDGKMEKYDMERRDGHSGILFHKYWTSKFMEKIREESFFND
jgi:hypothetical protein